MPLVTSGLIYRKAAKMMTAAGMSGSRFIRGAVEELEDLQDLQVSDLSVSKMEEIWQVLAPVLKNLAVNIVAAIAIYIIGRKLIRWLLKVLGKTLEKSHSDEGLSKFLLSAVRLALYFILTVAVVAQLGVNTASVFTLLGTAGLAVAMSLQGSLSNVAGGILILLMHPFRVGDFVIASSYGEGTVLMIGMVYTTIRTVDNRELAIPNGDLANAAVINVTANPERRLDILVGISYESDLRKAKRIIERVYRENENILKDREISVYVDSLGDSSVNLGAFGWVKTPDYLKTKWAITEAVKLGLDAGGISIPYPQMDVHLVDQK